MPKDNIQIQTILLIPLEEPGLLPCTLKLIDIIKCMILLLSFV